MLSSTVMVRLAAVNIPANTAFESFSKFLKLKKYSIGESNTTTGHLVFKTSLGGFRYILYNGNYIFSCDIISFDENRTRIKLQGVFSCDAEINLFESLFNSSAKLGEKIIKEFANNCDKQQVDEKNDLDVMFVQFFYLWL